MLVGAQNPCPCGYYGDSEHPCTCSPMLISRYQKRLSGPLLDRIDIHVEVPRVPFQKLSLIASTTNAAGEPSAADVRHDPGAGGSRAGATSGPVCDSEGRPRRRPHHQRGHGSDPGARPLPGGRDRPPHRRCWARPCSG
jgi:predicted ATPase with chaperone activity